jgi:ABC-type nitrate/sulfonate/bicarbonate transport system permease component/ABC-type nitrate/sulfonate/bicarbonate transport system substrate-binding protein
MTNWRSTVKRLRGSLTGLILVGFAVGTLVLAVIGSAQIASDFQNAREDNIAELLPAPGDIVAAWQTHRDDLLESYLPNTLRVTVIGLSIAAVGGVLLALVMDAVPVLRWVLYPVLILSQTIPIFAIAVILILVFGFGDSPKLVVIVLFCFFAITANTLDGLRGVNPQYLDLLRSMGATRWEIWWKVRLPSAAPSLFTGLRLAATYSVVGAVIGEYVGGGEGIGQFLQRSYRSFRTDQVYLAVILIALLSIALVGAVTLVEMLALRWRMAGRARSSIVLSWMTRRKQLFARGLTALLLIIVLGTVSALSAQDAEPEFARVQERTSVTLLLDWTPNTNHTGFYAAQALGFYDQANLDVEIIEPTDVPVEQAVSAGVAEFGIGFQDWSSMALAEGADIVSIAAIIQHNTSGFATFAADHPIDTPADLAPLQYAGYGLPALENAFLTRLLQCDGATWNTDNYLELGSSDLLQLVERGRADFTWIFYGWDAIRAELSGSQLDALLLGDYAECFPDYYTPILLTSSALIESDPALVAAFVQASARGFQVAIDDPEQGADILLEAAPQLDAELVYASAAWLADQYQADALRWGEQQLSIWEDFSALLYDNGIISTEIDAESAFTNDFLLPVPAESS